MAPFVSPFCSPLSSAILQRAEVPAGKQSRPIAPLPYPKWTNRGPPRRAKMNGSLSLSLSLHADSPLSDLRSCLCFQLSPHFFSTAATSRSLLPRYTTLSSFVHTTRFSPLCSFRFSLPDTALPSSRRSSLLPVQSCSPRCLIPLHCCAAFALVSHDILSLSLFPFSPSLSLSLCFFLFFSNLCSSPPAHFFRSFSSFPLLLFRALLSSQPEQFFWRLASHAFIRFFYRPNLLRFYTSPVSSRAFTVSPKNTPPTISLVCNFVSIVLIVPVTFSV